MEPHTPVNSNPATAFAWTASSPVSSVNGGSFAGTPQPTFHYGHQQSQGIVQQPQSSFVPSAYPPMFATPQVGPQQFGHQQGIENHLANHQFQRSLNQQTLQPPYHNQNRISHDHDAERQQRIRELKETVINPKPIINELVLHNGAEKAYKIQAHLTELIPAGANQIQKNKLSIKHAKRELRTLEEQTSLLEKQVSIFRSSLLPFLQSLNGQDSNVIVSFPFEQVPHLIGFWIKARINTVTAGKNLNKCPPAILQKVFGLTTYSALNDLTQDQLILILVALHDQDYSDQQCFKDHIEALKTAKVIKLNFFTRIYHGSKKNLSENTHRALVAIYLDLLGQGMNGFDLKRQNEPSVCPWDTPGDDYKSSQELKLERENKEMDFEYTTARNKKRKVEYNA